MNKNHNFLYTTMFIILSLVFGLFFSCSDNNLAIFYLLAHEEEIIQSDLEDELVVKSMVKADNDYFIAAGNIYTRPANGDSWDQVSNSGLPHKNAKCYYIAYFNEKIYGGFTFFESVDKISAGLYSAKPSSKPKWTEVDDDNINDKQVMNLMVEHDVLFVSVRDELNNYSLYYATNDINQFQDTGISEQSSPIVDIAYNSDATPDYWAISGSHIFTAPDTFPLDDFQEDHTDDVNDTSAYEGIYYSEKYNKIYLSKHNGKVFSYSKTDDEWQDKQIKEGNTNVQLYDFSQLIDQKNDEEFILVGSKGKGFYKITEGEIEKNPIERFGDVTVREIYEGTITRFLFDQEEGNIFLLTDGRGLWWNFYSDGSWDDWHRE